MSTVTWSSDGTSVTKAVRLDAPATAFAPRRAILSHHGHRPSPRRQYAYELRVNQLLARRTPPVTVPRLVAHDRARGVLTFERVPGEPFGPKFPQELASEDLRTLATLARATRTYAPRPRWLRRLPIQSRLRRGHASGLLAATEHRALASAVSGLGLRWVFGHGDVTPRNVLRGRDGPVLIDWEWAGLYPDGYELAFLWFVLADLPEARRMVAADIEGDPRGFWFCALLIQLLHLEWMEGPFRSRHLVTKDELVSRMLD
jgi:Ser/Thr protein kinase RdoA (MazF antagonist)